MVEKARTYPETEAIQTIPGVGALTAVAFVLVLNNDRSRFKRSRDVGCYLGLKPKQRDSGMRIAAVGHYQSWRPVDAPARHAECAVHPGSLWAGLGLAPLGSRPGESRRKNAKKRAVVAVARKLVVLMHRLWITQEVYDPMRGIRVQPAA